MASRMRGGNGNDSCDSAAMGDGGSYMCTLLAWILGSVMLPAWGPGMGYAVVRLACLYEFGYSEQPKIYILLWDARDAVMKALSS
jgi:hypothetical protein